MRDTNNHRWNGGKKKNKKKVLTEEERWEIHDRRVMTREKNRQKSSGRL